MTRPAQHDVVVVGSGPNGLAAAVICTAAGLSVEVVEAQPQTGGGCRTVELDLGVRLRHDLCSAVHPMAAASEFFERFALSERGVELAQPEAAYAQPMDGGRAAVAYRSLDRTIDELGGSDGRLFRRVMTPLVDAVQAVREIALSDFRSVPTAALTPRGLLAAVSMAGRALQLGTPLWERTTHADMCGALVTGVEAHANTVIPSVAGGGTALLLGALAHSHGWPIPVGGSQSITDALIADLTARGRPGVLWPADREGRRPAGRAGVPVRHRAVDRRARVRRPARRSLPARAAQLPPGQRSCEGGLRCVRRYSVGRRAGRRSAHRRQPRTDGAGGGRHRGRAAQRCPDGPAEPSDGGRPVTAGTGRRVSAVDGTPTYRTARRAT